MSTDRNENSWSLSEKRPPSATSSEVTTPHTESRSSRSEELPCSSVSSCWNMFVKNLHRIPM